MPISARIGIKIVAVTPVLQLLTIGLAKSTPFYSRIFLTSSLDLKVPSASFMSSVKGALIELRIWPSLSNIYLLLASRT